MSQKGVLSPEGSCKSFSADADGYARGEGILAIFIKPLEAAIRDGNPIRAVIRSTIANSDGKTQGIAQPNGKSHEAMIRKAYELAGITDYSKTAFVECHGTGTSVGDPIEASAVARVFGGDHGMHITSIKPNMGHSEGASGLSSLVKAVMALENRTIPPNIKFSAPNPKIPFKEFNITVPVEPTPFPAGRDRVSVNSFGLGGSNAHVVLDSARSFNLPPRARSSYPPSSPQLLLFSAASSPSLQKITSDFQKWVANNPDSLVDAAYTLANKREHFQHRSFLVVSPDVDGVVSQSKKVPNQTPSLVMIFTGQGAQWPRMGRELLLRKDLGFQSTIRELDKYLRVVPNAPEWTLEEELLKPAKTSRVQLAELSQPLCTAVQVALVDMLATVGVYPTAVVGHSSGELAAAYAAGALTAREAIISAFERGRAATNQTRKGAMAAVGLGWDDVNRYLDSDKVVVACENSPRSVTLSGDAPDVEATVARIKKAHPDITARLLKVEKAYHSYHMREIGDQYLATIKPHVESNIPQKLFFSSVTGSGKPHKDVLGAKYWQQNLESPVLFKSAVSGILDYIKNPAFLEIGPHGALAGPVRQILAQTSATAPYISAMSRGEDTVSSFLSAIGKLFELNVSIDFAALMPSGTTLASLPRYQWDHEVEYWRESRISSEWRGRKHPMHPLLGLRVLESTSLEPAFRNNLNLQHVSWLRDHKIEGNVIFPGAGYVAMAGEGIRQITGVENSYTIRHMVLSSALVVPEGTETEILTTFHPHRLTDSLDSKWWEFTVASHNGQVWTKHCSGQVTAGPAEPAAHKEEALLPRKVVAKKLYDVLDGAGIEYGDHFMRLRDIRTGTIERRSTATLAQDTTDDDDYFHLHPSVIDACLQTGPLAATCGRIDAKETRRVPTKLEEITVHRVAVGVDISASSSAVVAPGGGEVVGHLTCIADGKIVLEMQGATLSRLEEAAVIDTERLPITARLTWGPHIDFVDAGKLIRPEVPRHLYTPSLDELGRLCMVYTQRRIQDARALTETPHMQKYMAWISRQAAACDTSITGQTDVDIKDAVANLVSRLSSTPVASCADTLQKIFNNIDGLLSGEIDPLELLLADDTLTKIYVAIDAVDRSEFIKYMAHSRPNLRILEIGAGTGGSTAAILKDLVLPIGQPLYSKYTYTDISSGFFVAAKERFKSYRNIEYRALDISKNPAEQDMEGEKYDLILASNVLHATKSLQETLRNVRSLLAPNGRLLLQEMNSPSKWPNYIFGTLAGWWYGEPDGRPEEPYVTPARWESELKRAGFQGLDTVVLDGEEPHQLNSMIVAKPQNTETSNAKKTVTLLCDDGESQAAMLSKQLENRGYTVYQCQLGERLPPGQDVIALLDGGRPFFKDIQESRLKAFQGVLDNLGDSAMLWITRLSQMHCNDPQYAQIIGAARTIRNESLIDLATCEVDDIPSSLHKIIDVFARFQTRSEDEALKPDYEYAIVNGTVNTGRIYPFSLDQELLSKPDEQSSVILDVGKLGRLNTMQWIPRQARGLTGDEVEIEVHATGLNFKDVLGALAIVPYPEEGLGAEAAGVVARVGPGVKNLRIGDRVMLLAYGCFASHVVASERACATIPDDLTFDDAGSMPAIFTTAIAGLLKIGDLRKGQTVLIHSACGGVGLAAIQLAKMVGAEIFATVGSEEKVKYLTKVIGIPRNRIFNSRDDSFVADIMRETNGIGVDIALNSLSGELLHATWRCIAEFGKMVDIGKRDFLGAGKLDMNVFLGSRTYACFYLDRLLDVRKDSVQE
jgi:acyl transferase domain-containing protein/NADPH:quinone reductase-like Zn-dependent oxidoreductase/SAM-dependent methyltransferase